MSEPVAKVEKSWDGAVFNITWIGRHDMADGELLYTADAICEAVEAAHARMISDGWRQCAQGQRTTQFCGQLQKAVEAEREACASLIEPKNPRSDWTEYAETKAYCAAIIRARGAA